jgi:hypothetical protein
MVLEGAGIRWARLLQAIGIPGTGQAELRGQGLRGLHPARVVVSSPHSGEETGDQPAIWPKSATWPITSRTWPSSFRRLSRSAGTSELTSTSVEEPVHRARAGGQGRHGGGEVLGLQRGLDGGAGGADGEGQDGLGLGLVRQAGLDHAGRKRSLLLLGAEDVGGALVAGQQIGPVVGGEEGGQGLDPAHDADEVVVAQSEDGGDEVVALALVAEEDGQAVGEEGDQIAD